MILKKLKLKKKIFKIKKKTLKSEREMFVVVTVGQWSVSMHIKIIIMFKNEKSS